MDKFIVDELEVVIVVREEMRGVAGLETRRARPARCFPNKSAVSVSSVFACAFSACFLPSRSVRRGHLCTPLSLARCLCRCDAGSSD